MRLRTTFGAIIVWVLWTVNDMVNADYIEEHLSLRDAHGRDPISESASSFDPNDGTQYTQGIERKVPSLLLERKLRRDDLPKGIITRFPTRRPNESPTSRFDAMFDLQVAMKPPAKRPTGPTLLPSKRLTLSPAASVSPQVPSLSPPMAPFRKPNLQQSDHLSYHLSSHPTRNSSQNSAFHAEPTLSSTMSNAPMVKHIGNSSASNTNLPPRLSEPPILSPSSPPPASMWPKAMHSDSPSASNIPTVKASNPPSQSPIGFPYSPPPASMWQTAMHSDIPSTPNVPAVKASNPTSQSPNDSPASLPSASISPTAEHSDSPSASNVPTVKASNPPSSPASLPLASISPTAEHSDIPSASNVPAVKASNPPSINASNPPSINCPPKYDISKAATYIEGSEVELNGVVYRCNPYPFELYCTIGAFRPDSKSSLVPWQDAWEEIAACAVPTRISPLVTSQSTTKLPTPRLTKTPTMLPCDSPTPKPTAKPSKMPTSSPTIPPSNRPTLSPFASPTSHPSSAPATNPKLAPSVLPSDSPTAKPSKTPASFPTRQPSTGPTVSPSASPTKHPSNTPTIKLTLAPTTFPSLSQSDKPSHQPTTQTPTSKSTMQPSIGPTVNPSHPLTSVSTRRPSKTEVRRPAFQPSPQPSSQPTHDPTQRSTTADQPRDRPSFLSMTSGVPTLNKPSNLPETPTPTYGSELLLFPSVYPTKELMPSYPSISTVSNPTVPPSESMNAPEPNISYESSPNSPSSVVINVRTYIKLELRNHSGELSDDGIVVFERSCKSFLEAHIKYMFSSLSCEITHQQGELAGKHLRQLKNSLSLLLDVKVNGDVMVTDTINNESDVNFDDSIHEIFSGHSAEFVIALRNDGEHVTTDFDQTCQIIVYAGEAEKGSTSSKYLSSNNNALSGTVILWTTVGTAVVILAASLIVHQKRNRSPGTQLVVEAEPKKSCYNFDPLHIDSHSSDRYKIADELIFSDYGRIYKLPEDKGNWLGGKRKELDQSPPPAIFCLRPCSKTIPEPMNKVQDDILIPRSCSDFAQQSESAPGDTSNPLARSNSTDEPMKRVPDDIFSPISRSANVSEEEEIIPEKSSKKVLPLNPLPPSLVSSRSRSIADLSTGAVGKVGWATPSEETGIWPTLGSAQRHSTMNFIPNATSSSHVRSRWQGPARVLRHVVAPPGKMGIIIKQSTQGCMIHSVKPGSPMEYLLFGEDLIISFNDEMRIQHAASHIAACTHQICFASL